MSTVTLHLGDCRDVLRSIEPGSVDAVVTDPPYGTRVDRDGYGRRRLYQGKQHIEGDEDTAAMRDGLSLAFHCLKPHAWALVFCSPKQRREAEDSCLEAGFSVAGEIVWDKLCPGLGGGIRYQHETILLCAKGKPSGHAGISSVWGGSQRRISAKLFHPHEKPVRLMAKLVSYSAEEGDTVLDPFAGSGSTAVACIRTGRNFIGCEIGPGYFAIAEKRIAAERAKMSLFAGIEP